MKRIQITLLVQLLTVGLVAAQSSVSEKQTPDHGKHEAGAMTLIYVNKDVSTHFLSPEPVQFVDVSTKLMEGDLPASNVVRIKPVTDSLANNDELGIVTIVGQKFMAQYRMIYTTETAKANAKVEMGGADMGGFNHPDFTLSEPELHRYAYEALQRKPSYHDVKSTAYDMTAYLNNIFTVGEYFFVDVSFYNKTNIEYSIDQIRFKIEDKKITKATNVQEVEIKSVFDLQNAKTFKKKYRNVFVFKKFTFPGDKVFTIELAEDQISGRVIYLQVDYKDVLKADTL